MKKRKPDEFGRAGVSELVSIFKRMREDASGELSPRAFLRRVRACLDDPETRAVLLKSLEAYVAGDWPAYVSGAEPEAESALSRRLFPKAHAGNVRRLVGFVYASPAGQALAPSTRAYVVLSELILACLSPWTDRSYTAFTCYLRSDLGVPDTFNIRRVHLYWRHLPLSAWAADRARADAPRNAEAVMAFASMVRRCICSGGTEPDEPLWSTR